MDIFDGNNTIKQKTAILKKINFGGCFVGITKVVESRNSFAFNFNRNGPGIKRSTPIVRRHLVRLNSIFKEKKHCTFMSNQGGALS